MPLEIPCPTAPSPSAVAAIDLAALHLHRVSDRLSAVVATVRRLAASTDWETPAAREFFGLAERLTADVLALRSAADAVRTDIVLARARLATENAWDCR